MNTNSHHKIAVIGAGSWGTALSIHLAHIGHRVNLWGNNKTEQLDMLRNKHNAAYLDDTTPFPPSLTVQTELTATLADTDGMLIVVPSHVFTKVVTTLKKYNLPKYIAYATKGLVSNDNDNTNMLIHTFLQQENITATAISGPTFAKEVASGLPSALVVASDQEELRAWWQNCLHGARMRTYSQTDVIGVEVGGALKNIIAIAVGISDGLQYGANARAALITRGLAEITRFAIKLGASVQTLNGLAGIGDLVLTATDNQSRNRRLGLLLAQNKTLEVACAEIGQVVEGIEAVNRTYAISEKMGIEMPITKEIYGIINHTQNIEQMVNNLLNRESKQE